MPQNTAYDDAEKWGTVMFKRKFTDDPLQASAEIEALGLDKRMLIDAIMAADRQRALCAPSHPKGWDLISMNAELARTLRDSFCGIDRADNDWDHYEQNNQPGIVSERRKLIVVPCNFDKECANPKKDPTNIRPKGSASGRHAECNGTGWLFDPDPYSRPQSQSEFTRWVLGTFFCEESKTIFAELSCPDGFVSGQYKSFKHRIPLLDAADASQNLNEDKDGDDAPTEFIDIPIQRK